MMDRRAFVRTLSGGAIATAAMRTNIQPASAAPAKTYYGLVVNGSPNLLLSYDANDYLLVRNLRRTTKAAGGPSDYIRTVPPGSAAFPDRPLTPTEPLTLKQQLTPDLAQAALARLKQNGGYWLFYVWNTGQGYFEVLKSHATYASVPID